MGVPVHVLAAVVEKRKIVAHEGGTCLFHESTPREWFGIVADGEVEIVRGLRGQQTHLATLTKGALISEGLLLDDTCTTAWVVTKLVIASSQWLQLPVGELLLMRPFVLNRRHWRNSRRGSLRFLLAPANDGFGHCHQLTCIYNLGWSEVEFRRKSAEMFDLLVR